MRDIIHKIQEINNKIDFNEIYRNVCNPYSNASFPDRQANETSLIEQSK